MDNESMNPGSYPQPSQFETSQPEQQPNQYQPPYPSPNQPPYPPQYNYPPPQQQQQQQQQTTVIINQPQTTGTQKGQPQNIRPWSTGLCGCFEDCGGCMYCFCCYPFFLRGLALDMDECYCGPTCFGTFFTSSMRTKIRAQYGITGSIFEDVMCVAFCEMCSMHQIYRELKYIGRLN